MHLLLLLLVIALDHISLLCIEPVFELILLFGKFSLHLFQLHRVLLNRLRLLIDLLLQRARHFHHLLIVLIDPIAGAIDIFLQILKTKRPLIEANIE